MHFLIPNIGKTNKLNFVRVPIRLSVRPMFFFESDSSIFSDFLHEVRSKATKKSGLVGIFRKNSYFGQDRLKY